MFRILIIDMRVITTKYVNEIKQSQLNATSEILKYYKLSLPHCYHFYDI